MAGINFDSPNFSSGNSAEPILVHLRVVSSPVLVVAQTGEPGAHAAVAVGSAAWGGRERLAAWELWAAKGGWLS